VRKSKKTQKNDDWTTVTYKTGNLFGKGERKSSERKGSFERRRVVYPRHLLYSLLRCVFFFLEPFEYEKTPFACFENETNL